MIYQTRLRGEVVGPNGVCDQDEWEMMELARPGVNLLVRSGIESEGIAERLARGTSGDTKPRVSRDSVRLSLLS
ncbi:hypothetical protein FRUB_10586 [Fimbriiglobus ruber]|uniref:Uncharacterized protein n=1 Tax=Fimbriiglobus ruber TaxID=1908690 RepID=A0A225DDY8_9BACT|nr:hypothetical protein FRUB_10586 [Fimbriiglobus ruber]